MNKTEKMRKKISEKTVKKNVESMKRNERKKAEELVNNLNATGENAQAETSRTRSVRRKN